MHNNNARPDEPGWMSGLEPLSRRGFLRTAVLGAVALSSGCASLTGRRQRVTPSSRYQHLTEDEALVLRQLTRVLLPTRDFDLPSSLSEVPTVQNIDGMVGQMSPQTRELLGLGLWLFERRPMASFRFSRFSRLDDAEALRYVNAMQAGTFFERGLMTTLKTLVCVNYWRDARTWPALDYHGPVTELWGVRRLGNAPLPQA